MNAQHITEFVSAYPFNTQVRELEGYSEILVSNREKSFTLCLFDGGGIEIDGAPASILEILELIAPGDESAVEDWRLLCEREKFIDKPFEVGESVLVRRKRYGSEEIYETNEKIVEFDKENRVFVTINEDGDYSDSPAKYLRHVS